MWRCVLLLFVFCIGFACAQNNVSRAWSVRLSVQVGAYSDTDNLFGQSKVSRAFLDPPSAPGHPARVRLTFAHGGSVDVRAFSRARTRWEFTVETGMEDADVVLRWENVAKVPRQVNLRLVDVETGRRFWMRTAPSYTLRSGKGVTRRQFAVEMDTDARMPLRIFQMKAQQTPFIWSTTACGRPTGDDRLRHRWRRRRTPYRPATALWKKPSHLPRRRKGRWSKR